MNITDVKVFPVEEEKLKAYATITFDNCFIVRDLKVISGNKGYFIAMPSKKRKDGTFRDVAHPLNSETRKMIEDAVLEVYEREAAAGETQPSITTDDPVADLEETVVEKEDTPVEAAPVSSEAEDKGAEAAEPDQEPTEEPVMESSASVEEEPEKKPVDNPSIEPSQDPEKAFGYEE